LGFHKNKKPCRPFGGQGLENSGLSLEVSLLPGRRIFIGPNQRATRRDGHGYANPHGVARRKTFAGVGLSHFGGDDRDTYNAVNVFL
jgi:hypothetical protein